jgi:putative transposase
LSYQERCKLVWDSPQLSRRRQCKLLCISKSSLYYTWEYTEKDYEIMRHIDEIYTENPCYGSRRISVMLKRRWYNVWRKKTRKYMRIMGLEVFYPKPRTTVRNKEHRVYPYLLRWVSIERSNQVRSTDITYIRMRTGWVYMVAVIDWYSRYIIDWDLSTSLEATFCVDTLQCAVASWEKPEIFNSDQWVQFTSKEFTWVLKEYGIRISMDGRWRCYDNILVERLWRTIKQEEVYLKDYDNPLEVYVEMNKYVKKYNTQRPHASLGYKTPWEVYAEKENKNKQSILYKTKNGLEKGTT